MHSIFTKHVQHGVEGMRKHNKSNQSSVTLVTNSAAGENINNVATLTYSEEDGGNGTMEMKSGVIGHWVFVPRVKQKMHDIELEAESA